MHENPFTTEMVALAKRHELELRVRRQHITDLLAIDDANRPGIRATIAGALMRIARAIDGATVAELSPRPSR